MNPVRIGNCSGFYGDRHAAMREMVTGGELDYLTGDYLAELTMLILARDRAKSPDRGYAKTFLTQLEESLGTALDKRREDRRQRGRAQPGRPGRRRPGAGRAARPRRQRRPRRGRRPGRPRRRAGLRHARSRPTPTSARGASSTASNAGADVVVTGRVTDASVIVGPAAAHFGWTRTDYDAPRRRGGRRPRHRMRHPGHRRQLRVLHRGTRPAAPRLPDRRDRRRRLVGHHQAPRHRRAGQRRHRHRAAALRDRRRRATPTPT